MDYKAAAIKWLANRGIPGKIIAQRERGDQYSVVLDTGPNIYIPLAVLDAQEAPEPEPPPAPKPKPKRKARRRSKSNG